MNIGWKDFLVFITFPLGIWFILGYCAQVDFDLFFMLFLCSFMGYIYLARLQLNFKSILGFGIVIRLGTLVFFPQLSDDIFRFYWDGLLTIGGVNPYGVLPSDALLLGIEGVNFGLFEQLNSPDYFTIYPPVAQLVYAMSAFSGSVMTAVIAMKILFFLVEIIGFRAIVLLLRHTSKPASYAAWYFLNPLVIIEGIGNLHFEVLMVGVLAWSIYFLIKQRFFSSSVLLAISIGIKLLPLMLLPYLWFYLSGKVRMIFFGTLTISLLLIFSSLILSFEASSFLNSLDLYFRKFEFNASIYYLLRYIGIEISGYNLIKYLGPALGLITLVINVLLAYRLRKSTINTYFKYAFMVWGLYLLLATTVHPWYIIPLVFLSLFVDTKAAILWSFLAALSYVNYSGETYYENLWIVAFEYSLLLAFLIWEFTSRSKDEVLLVAVDIKKSP